MKKLLPILKSFAIIMALLIFTFVHVYAQTIAIYGKAVDAQTLAAVPGATVKLIVQNITTTTDANGDFCFNRLSSGIESPGSNNNTYDISIRNGVLRINNASGFSGNAVVELFDISGKCFFRETGNSSREYPLTDNMSKGIFFVRVTTDTNSIVYKLFTMCNMNAVSLNPNHSDTSEHSFPDVVAETSDDVLRSQGKGFGKKGSIAEPVDSILITKTGYQIKTITLTTYQVQLSNVPLFKIGASVWTEQILNGDGTINWTQYENAASNAGDSAMRDYLLGPKYAYYHPREEAIPTLALQGDTDGWEGPVSMKPPVCLTASHNDWYAQAGPLLYVADDPDNAGVVEAANGEMFIFRNLSPQYGFWCRLHWGDANAEGWYTYTHPVELGQFNYPRKPTAVASPTGIAAHPLYVAFQNGLIGTFPVIPKQYPWNGLQFPFEQLPAGKIPMALTVTPAGEFVLAAVWDVINHKGQVAVITVQTKVLCSEPVYRDFNSCFTGTFMYGFPTWPTTKSMKLLGFIDLPIAAPTAIEAGTDLAWLNSGRSESIVNKNIDALLDNQSERDTWYNSDPQAGYPNFKVTAHAGYVMVASRSENKVVFVDLQPLLSYYRTMYFTTQALFNETKNVGQAANQWPYTFDYSPQQKPVVAYTLDVPAPTAVAVGLSAGSCGGSGSAPCWGTAHWRASLFGDGYAYVTTMDGKLFMYTVGGLNTEADASQPVLYMTVNIGKNPTSISHGNGGVYKNDLFINCRGDKSVYVFNPGGEQLYVLRDSRMEDPVAVENSYNGRQEFSRYFVHVVDFTGKKVLTYVYKQGFPEPIKFGAAVDVPGYPFTYQQDEVP